MAPGAAASDLMPADGAKCGVIVASFAGQDFVIEVFLQVAASKGRHDAAAAGQIDDGGLMSAACDLACR